MTSAVKGEESLSSADKWSSSDSDLQTPNCKSLRSTVVLWRFITNC